MPAPPQRPGRDAQRPRFRQQFVEQTVHLHLTQSPVRIGRNERGRLVEYGERHAGLVRARADGVHVLRNAHDAVRIVPAQVRIDETVRDDGGIRGGNPGGFKERARERGERGSGESGHGSSSSGMFLFVVTRFTGSHRFSGASSSRAKNRAAARPRPAEAGHYEQPVPYLGYNSLRVSAPRKEARHGVRSADQSAQAGDRNGEVYELIDTAGTVRAEVWPQWGFNCLNWQLRRDDAHWTDILFHMPDWESNPVPTRSGHPILFPFPGRLRDGRLHLRRQDVSAPAHRQHQAARHPRFYAAVAVAGDRLERRRRLRLRHRPVQPEEGLARSAGVLARGFRLQRDLPAVREQAARGRARRERGPGATAVRPRLPRLLPTARRPTIRTSGTTRSRRT